MSTAIVYLLCIRVIYHNGIGNVKYVDDKMLVRINQKTNKNNSYKAK